MIIIQLLGGLGNQMFQYALGRRLANDFQTTFSVDRFLLEDHSTGRHAVNRNFDLDIFAADIPRANILMTMKYSAWGLPRPLRPVARALGVTNEGRQTLERSFGFDSDVLRCGPDAYISGTWQSIRYFDSIEEILKEDFQFRHPIMPEALHIEKAICGTNAICLHVRRTDFLSHKDSKNPLGFVGLDYYRNGVKRILEESSDAEFFVFSDDLEWCREELTFVPRITFVSGQYAGVKCSSYLQLMKMCRHFLIPNSTFSWWAAWLCPHASKTVYVPDQWFRDPKMDASGLYPEGWIRITI